MYKRFRYLDSKYEYGDSLVNMTTIRTNVIQNMTVTYSMKMYGHVRYNAESVEIRVEKDIPYEFVSNAAGAEDRVIGLPDSDMIADIGDMSGHMVELIDTSKLTRIVRLKLGSDAEGYVNRSLTNLTLGNNKLLRYLDVRNCPELKTSIDASGCTGLEEAYFDGTSITGLGLPNGGILKILHLPETVVNLTLRNQTKLEVFIMPSYANVSTLWLEGNSDAVDVAAILQFVADNARIRVLGINLEFENGNALDSFLGRLDSMRGLDESGNNVDTAQVSGSVHVGALSYEVYENLPSIRAKYPDLAITYDTVSVKSVEILDGTLSGDYRNDTAESICQSNVLQQRSGCKSWTFTKVKTVSDYAMLSNFACTVGKIDLHAVTSMGAQAFIAIKCGIYIIRTPDQVCTLKRNASDIFRGTPKFYVPAALLDSYKAATNWSAVADNIYTIEDHPDICGGE